MASSAASSASVASASTAASSSAPSAVSLPLPAHSALDATHYGAYPTNRFPHKDFSMERRHFAGRNAQSSERAEPIRPRVEPSFSSLEDRPHGKRCALEADVYADTKLAASRIVDRRGCRHYPAAPPSEEQQFAKGGKNMTVGAAQSRSSAESKIEDSFGRITRLTEEQLQRRVELSAPRTAIEYTRDFYKFGATVPAVDMNSKSSKSMLSFVGQDLKSKMLSAKSWNATKPRDSRAVDARKQKTYAEAEAERTLAYEQRMVAELPDEILPPVDEVLPPPPPPAKEETKKEKSAREKKERAEAKAKQLAANG